MSWQALVFFGISVTMVLGLFFYWAIWLTEGAYFGSWAVRWLYDWGASTYDEVKLFDPLDEAAFLANPIFSRLEESFGARSLLLDVATGTARLPLALFAIPFYEGEIVALDQSRGMLAQAAHKTAAHNKQITLLHHSSVPLPFDSEIFDAVTSLEALEFMPDRHAALREMVRVLRPGGWFVVSNRIGIDARLMPTRSDSPEKFEALLASIGLVEIITRPWQEYYDLIFARKPGTAKKGNGFSNMWRLGLRCPHCHTSGDLSRAPSGNKAGKMGSEKGASASQEWRCGACDDGMIMIAEDGVWEMGG